MKFAKGQRVTLPVWEGAAYCERTHGEVVHAFVVKTFAQPDVNHYNVRVGKEIHEYSEGELT